MLTNLPINDIILDDEKEADFLLSKNWTQSKVKKPNRFFLIPEMRPFILENRMKKNFKEQICIVCKKIFKPTNNRQKICSKECVKTIPYRHKFYRKCTVCGKNFYPSRKEYFTCSKKCGCRLRQGKSAYSQTETKCDWCGKVFTKIKSRVLNRNYCSTRCYYSHKKFTQHGENNSKWRGGKPTRICPLCKKEFKSYSKDSVYCSRECAAKGLGMINLYKKGTTYEYVVKKQFQDLGYIVVRSSGSRSPFDLIAINKNEIVFIQCKRCKKINKNIQLEMEDFKKFELPLNCRKEFRIKKDYENEQIYKF